MSKSAKKLTVEAAFQKWMQGESFVTVKQQAGRPLMDAFTKLAGVSTWKQARQVRKAAIKKATVAK